MIAGADLYSNKEASVQTVFSGKEYEPDKYTSVNRLIAECGRSKECLSRLYTMFKGSVFAVAYGIVADYHLAEDCVAETFVRLAQVKRFSEKKGDGKGFILTIARNVALETRRRFRRDVSDVYLQNYGSADSIVENSIFINQLLKNLNDKQRQVVVMKCCADLTFKQIAKIMKSPESTVKSRYQKAMQILKEKAGE
ncbi:MAG: sigma-70 family RNA polymerase sigma factor [Ruminococcus sp.]|jgi:RNA polymerase sigma factor (sigma-70 family)|nr:sigma-70 family RNA polymerase sigma factor [Ruminococcus sp.]